VSGKIGRMKGDDDFDRGWLDDFSSVLASLGWLVE
jgi:hypothetical protein